MDFSAFTCRPDIKSGMEISNAFKSYNPSTDDNLCCIQLDFYYSLKFMF